VLIGVKFDPLFDFRHLAGCIFFQEVIEVEICELLKRFGVLFLIRYAAEVLVREALIDRVISRWVQEPPEPKGDVERGQAQGSEHYSRTLLTARNCCRQILHEELSKASAMLQQARIHDLLVEQPLEALTFHDLLKGLRTELRSGDAGDQMLQKLCTDVLVELVQNCEKAWLFVLR